MKRIIFVAIFALLAAGAQAFPPIVFYNYTPPMPQFDMVAMKPQDHQIFNNIPPQVVNAIFSMPIDPDKSTLKVFDEFNNLLQTGPLTFKDSSMSVALPTKLLRETYRIDWNATCLCKDNPTSKGTSYFIMY